MQEEQLKVGGINDKIQLPTDSNSHHWKIQEVSPVREKQGIRNSSLMEARTRLPHYHLPYKVSVPGVGVGVGLDNQNRATIIGTIVYCPTAWGPHGELKHHAVGPVVSVKGVCGGLPCWPPWRAEAPRSGPSGERQGGPRGSPPRKIWTKKHVFNRKKY
ncbi:hypothetical protein DFH07DRAFT_765517 [Mycena maculata]|uniref:Uncharacterized protein n=1 Tax=Mycena maculata TaxID=230809 RepID=A0AAD7KA85_9AGAR|nr:hypothetical protein DFH07DRAFT_765517 [Mycena maculata]